MAEVPRRWAFQVSLYEGRLRTGTNLSRLAPDAKRRTWERIKREDPAAAELLQGATVAAFRELLDAEVFYDFGDKNDGR